MSSVKKSSSLQVLARTTLKLKDVATRYGMRLDGVILKGLDMISFCNIWSYSYLSPPRSLTPPPEKTVLTPSTTPPPVDSSLLAITATGRLFMWDVWSISSAIDIGDKSLITPSSLMFDPWTVDVEDNIDASTEELPDNLPPPPLPKSKKFNNRKSMISIAMESGSSGDDGFDFELTLKDFIRQRGEESIKARELGMMFNDLRVVGLGACALLQPTMGLMLNPFTALNNITTMRNPPICDILSGFEGVVMPGEMLHKSIVLGCPGSGCSTFLKVLSNQTLEYHTVKGDVWYDSFTPEEIAKQYQGDVIYCPEDDVHFPTLTVEQTLSFAIKTHTPHAHFIDQSHEEFNRDVVNILIRIFGLHHTHNTIVGNATI
ncbi:hypothetical protein BD769DRAFT_1778685 [Suillus cothurnatus]|nr:hypothetical protein BD769DRAFT_1778685 [Suillus cothurnatus]